jgi:hypothetical protein
MQQPTNNKAGNGKGSKGEASGAQNQRGGAAACNATTNKQMSRDQHAGGMQATAKLNAIFATAALPLSIVVSSAPAFGALFPSAQCVFRHRVGSSTLLSLSCQPPNCLASSTPALSDCPASSTFASHCVIHHPITLQSVVCPSPLVVSFAAQSPCIACHPLVSHSPPSLLSRCPPPACLASSTAPSCGVIQYPLTPHILYLGLIVAFPLLLSPPP